jgi:predicted dehydrogenase
MVGCGYISDVYMEAFRGLPEVRVAAACDTDAERLAAFCAKYHLERGFTDVGKLLEWDELSFVVIATPPSTHHSLCQAALERGVPALVEKPVCLSLREAQELAERSARTGVPVAVMQNYRFKDAVLKARWLQQSGELGELRRVDCIYHGGNPGDHQENWRQHERRNRLLLYEWAEHFLDIEIAFAGPVKKILDVRAATRPGNDSTLAVNALVEHVTGVTGSVDLQLFSGAEFVRVELHGSRGRVVVKFYPEGCAAYRGLITPLHELLEESKRTARYAWGVVYERLSPARVSRRALSHWRFLRQYVAFLQGKEPCLPLSIEQGLATMAFLDQLAAAVY